MNRATRARALPGAGQSAPLNEALEVAEYLRCGRTHVFALIKSGRLRSVKVGRKRLVPDHRVLAFIQEQTSSNRLIR